MDLITLVVGGLAVWRISHIVANEAGPGGVFLRIQARLAKRGVQDGGLYELSSCIFCLSVYVGLIVAVFMSSSLSGWILNGFALSGAALLVNSFIKK